MSVLLILVFPHGPPTVRTPPLWGTVPTKSSIGPSGEATANLASKRPREVKEIAVSNWSNRRNTEEADTLHAPNLRTTDTDACQASSFLEKHEKAWLPRKAQMWGGSARRC